MNGLRVVAWSGCLLLLGVNAGCGSGGDPGVEAGTVQNTTSPTEQTEGRSVEEQMQQQYEILLNTNSPKGAVGKLCWSEWEVLGAVFGELGAISFMQEQASIPGGLEEGEFADQFRLDLPQQAQAVLDSTEQSLADAEIMLVEVLEDPELPTDLAPYVKHLIEDVEEASTIVESGLESVVSGEVSAGDAAVGIYDSMIAQSEGARGLFDYMNYPGFDTYLEFAAASGMCPATVNGMEL